MSKSSKFFKKGEVSLKNGGYLSDSEGNPINHSAFVKAQERGHFLVTLAAKMKGKTFTAEAPANIQDLVNEVNAELSSSKTESFVEVPTVSKGELTEKLANEALSFIENTDKAEAATKVNEKLQEFNILKEFEEFGLFFKQGIVKLNKIYSVEEIVAAATTVYAVLD